MDILKIAASQLGITEISGDKNHSQIVKYATETGIEGINNDETPWCSTFINWCAKEADLPFSGKATARSWINIGKTVTNPSPGDVVIFWREDPLSWKGHVGLFLGFNASHSQVFCLGGNQSNAVTISSYDINKVLSYQRLSKVNPLTIPTSKLHKGKKGKEVMELQLLLNHLNYNCGDTDGDFGAKTDTALKLLQANNHLTIDGIYHSKTRNCIESLLQT
jgi:uncharacterized protein (TIGR02594 family)